jgi:hypothetical protein
MTNSIHNQINKIRTGAKTDFSDALEVAAYVVDGILDNADRCGLIMSVSKGFEVYCEEVELDQEVEAEAKKLASEHINSLETYLMHPISGDVQTAKDWTTEMESGDWEGGLEEGDDRFVSSSEQFDSVLDVTLDENGDWVAP